MIEFKTVGDGTPKDIEVTTDDADAEMAMMTDAFEEADAQDMQAAINLDACKAGPPFTFIIPGDEAGEVGDIFGGEVPLDDFLDELNAKTIADAEGRGSE